MPFTVNYRGLPVQCETIEDLNRLAEQLEINRAKEARKTRRVGQPQGQTTPLFTTSSASEKSVYGLVCGLKDQQRMLLSEINTSARSDSELRALLHLANNKALAGVLSGISKAAKRLGTQVPIEKQMSRSSSGDREYRYSISPDVAEEVQRALLNGHA